MGRDLTGVLDAVLAGLVVVDADCTIELLNSAASRILETSAEASIRQPLERLFADGSPIPAMVRKVIRTGGSTSENEFLIERRFADDLIVDVTASPLFDTKGPASGAVLALRDRTIQISLEKVIEDRESIAAFGSIAAGIAHEVKNPLGGIRGAAELLIARTEEPRTRDIAEIIVREVQRIAALVDDLMVFTQGDAVKFAPVNIHRILDEVVDLLTLDPISEGITIERFYDPSIPELMADGDRLAQVFLNLARNAVQAMESTGGKLMVRTRMPLDHRLARFDGTPIPTLLVSISDTGRGIPADVLHKLATPFFTTRPDGLGLGLAVSRNWIMRHGGTLNIESREGEGTTVQVSLPLRKSES
jgi:two-component system nitrogen regulation sensor histidine kinase GlnL